MLPIRIYSNLWYFLNVFVLFIFPFKNFNSVIQSYLNFKIGFTEILIKIKYFKLFTIFQVILLKKGVLLKKKKKEDYNAKVIHI